MRKSVIGISFSDKFVLLTVRELLHSFQIIRYFSFSRYVNFVIYLDIVSQFVIKLIYLEKLKVL
jgi:hypothetical protein